MPGKDRHPGPHQFVGMDGIAADLGLGLHHSSQVCPSLQQLETHHQAYIAAAHHDDSAARQHPVQVHHGLGGARTHHPGEVPAGEGQGLFGSAGSDQNLFRPDDTAVPGMGNTQSPSGKDAVNSVGKADLHPGCFAFRQQPAAQLHPAYPGPVVPGAEKLVNLLKELTAGAVVFIISGDPRAAAGQHRRSGKPGRPGPYYGHLGVLTHGDHPTFPGHAVFLPACPPPPG